MKKLLLFSALLCFVNTIAQQKTVFDIARSGTLAEIEHLNQSHPGLIDTINENNSSPLILACYKANIVVAKFLIANVKDLNYKSDMGTALMAATYKNQIELVQLLLQKNANPNGVDANGTTALSLAVQFRNTSLVQLLLEYNADKTIKDIKGKTPFEYAVFAKNDEIINLLK